MRPLESDFPTFVEHEFLEQRVCRLERTVVVLSASVFALGALVLFLTIGGGF